MPSSSTPAVEAVKLACTGAFDERTFRLRVLARRARREAGREMRVSRPSVRSEERARGSPRVEEGGATRNR